MFATGSTAIGGTSGNGIAAGPLCADVHTYSRLMGKDEAATLHNLSSHRTVIDGLIEQHRGFVNSPGDSVLAEFASVINAVP
jgi:adenylate cyclase